MDPEKAHEALRSAVVDLPRYMDGVRIFLDRMRSGDQWKPDDDRPRVGRAEPAPSERTASASA